MLIRSQDKKAIFNLNRINIINITGYRVGDSPKEVYLDDESANIWYICASFDERILFLGRYSSERNAVKVLDMICSFADGIHYEQVVPEQCKNICGFVFQMPQDEEIIA